MKILIAVDGSEYTRRALDYLASTGEWLAPANRIVALTVVAAVPPRAAAALAPAVASGYYDDEAEAVLGPVRAFFQAQGVAADMVHKVGRAADEIGRFSREQDVDLIVMGSHGQGPLGGLVMGSVVTRVLASCKTPVLIVR